jgi:hypothetical protein
MLSIVVIQADIPWLRGSEFTPNPNLAGDAGPGHTCHLETI